MPTPAMIIRARAGREEPWGHTELLQEPSKVCVTITWLIFYLNLLGVLKESTELTLSQSLSVSLSLSLSLSLITISF